MKVDTNIGFIGWWNVSEKLANSLLLANYNLLLYDKDKLKVDNLVNEVLKLNFN
jgi:hypothetical protein|tara:strand:+ start:146 stop:307 length:162 start_codon:yes stop_codon:yes gene_type:complete